VTNSKMLASYQGHIQVNRAKPMTLEEIKCFCESKRATVQIESPIGTITFLPTGIQIGPTLFAWQGEAPPVLASQVLEKADKFVIQPKFGEALELSLEKFEQLLKT